MHTIKEMVLMMKKNHRSMKEICARTGLEEADVRSVLEGEDAPQVGNKPAPENRKIFENLIPATYSSNWDGKTLIKFGLIGDTHINSKYTQLTALHNFYKICAENGITDVYHTGDIDDGEQMRPGHQYDCYNQGADDHVSEIIQNYPKVDGITTHFITGNHDSSMYKHCGVDIGKAIAFQRPDMHYLGRDWARVELAPHCILELRHPWDGSSYALSYKPQKMIESMESDSKPNILAIGHYHKMEYLFYRNVHCFQTGCFQSQTPFTRGKGLSVNIGGWIITVAVDQNGYVHRMIPEMIPIYKGITDDWKSWRY